MRELLLPSSVPDTLSTFSYPNFAALFSLLQDQQAVSNVLIDWPRWRNTLHLGAILFHVCTSDADLCIQMRNYTTNPTSNPLSMQCLACQVVCPHANNLLLLLALQPSWLIIEHRVHWVSPFSSPWNYIIIHAADQKCRCNSHFSSFHLKDRSRKITIWARKGKMQSWQSLSTLSPHLSLLKWFCSEWASQFFGLLSTEKLAVEIEEVLGWQHFLPGQSH